MPPDRDPFNPPLSAALLASEVLHVQAQDGLTHYLDNRAGRTVARCGATGGTRLTLKWELVSCQACRVPDVLKASGGLYPVGYRFRCGGKTHTVTGHREIGYGQVGHEVDCEGVSCWQSYEYIRDNGQAAR